MGNLRSVQKAFELLGAKAVIVRHPGELEQADRMVLPGVGAFADGMAHLAERRWIEPFLQGVAAGKPTLGICLGMQLMFDSSEEDAVLPGEPLKGLGIFKGRVVRFKGDQYGAGRLKVPHMGWNTLAWSRKDPLLEGIGQAGSVYFVHSYYAVPDKSDSASVPSSFSDYGGPFCASVWRGNVWATQFHPEKSQRTGLRMLRNFVHTSP